MDTTILAVSAVKPQNHNSVECWGIGQWTMEEEEEKDMRGRACKLQDVDYGSRWFEEESK